MKIFRGYRHAGLAASCALTIGNFDGVHRGHQALLALLKNEAIHRQLPACVLTFEPHPREYFSPQTAPARIGTLRDKLTELARCSIDQVVVLPFNAALAKLAPHTFIQTVLQNGLGARYVLVGDDFRFGARRAGDYALLDATGDQFGFDVARMNSYEVHGLRVSSSAVRTALEQGHMEQVARLLGRPYSISGHVVHGKKLGRQLGFPTLNLALGRRKPAAHGIFMVQIHGLTVEPLRGVASLGVRPTVETAGPVWLEVHCFDWPLAADAGYGQVVRVELLHKLRDEQHYANIADLRQAIQEDCAQTHSWFENRCLKTGSTPDNPRPN